MGDTISDPSDGNDHHTTTEVHWAPIPQAVLYDQDLSDKAVRVYGALMRHGLDPSSCFPSHARIAELIGCSKRSVQRPVVELETAGWIERVPRWTDGQRISRDPAVAGAAGWERTSDGFHVRTSRAHVRGVRAGERGPSAQENADVRVPARDEREQENESQGTRERASLFDPPLSAVVDEIVESQRSAREIGSITGAVEFDRFWSAYPRRAGKGDARKAWAKAIRKATPATIVEAAERYAADPNLPPATYVPHPATWLNREGWTDEPLPPRNGTPTRSAQTIDHDRDGYEGRLVFNDRGELVPAEEDPHGPVR